MVHLNLSQGISYQNQVFIMAFLSASRKMLEYTEILGFRTLSIVRIFPK
jgi:hypothetical protein